MAPTSSVMALEGTRPADSLVSMIAEDSRFSRSWFDGYVLSKVNDRPAQTNSDVVDNDSMDGDLLTDKCPMRRLRSSSAQVVSRSSSLEDMVTSDESSVELVGHRCCCTKQDHSASQGTVSENPNGSSGLRKWYTKWVRDWWALEVGSIVLGTLCILVIAIMLLKVNGEEMSTWQLGISIDALLSLLSGFCKLCLLMPTAEALGQLRWPLDPQDHRRAIDAERIDRASRGTWGSVVLLIRARGVTLASLGVAIVLLSLPLDLCFQQILSYPARRVLDPSVNATVARAITYDPPDGLRWTGDDWSLGADSQTSTFSYRSWYTEATEGPGTQFSCPSGFCQFAPFHTIALDFECKLLPQNLLRYGCRDMPNDWQFGIAFGIDELNNVTNCGHYLDIPESPTGAQLMSGYGLEPARSAQQFLATRIFGLMDVWTNQKFLNGSMLFPQVRSRIVDFIVAATPGSFDGVRANSTPVLTECEVHWVVQLIQSEVRDGLLHERVLKTVPFENDPSEHWDAEDPNWYKLQPNMTLHGSDDKRGETTYSLNNITARKVWQTWTNLVPSSLIELQNHSAAINPEGKRVHFFKLATFNGRPGAPEVVPLTKEDSFPWAASKNVSAHMAGIVKTMNQMIRNKSLSLKKDVAVGQVWRDTVLVDVKWAWFAFPATLWTVAVIFLTITIWRTSGPTESIGPYKTSLLPMLVDSEQGCCYDKSMPRSIGSLRNLAKLTALEVRSSHEGK